MSKKQKGIGRICMILCVLMALTMVPECSMQNVFAQTTEISGNSAEIVCGMQVKWKTPYGYWNCSFTSSNEKVASVSAKGIVKAKRLGTAKIVAKSGNRQTSCTVTVKPEQSGDVWLNQEAFLTNQKFTLKLASKKYDVSQIKLSVSSGFKEIDKNGYCKGIQSTGYASLHYSYGSFRQATRVSVYSPDNILDEIMQNPYGKQGMCQLDAGKKQKIRIKSMLDFDKKISPQELRKYGISLLLDGKKMADTVCLKPGKHEITIVSGKQKYNKKMNVTYSIKDTLLKKNATGYDADCKKVFDKAFSIVNKIIKDDMTDKEKVKAIHDYLIYHANYAEGKNSNWIFGAEGVLLHGEGVCQSYSIAFYMMATSAGLDCRYITGKVDGTGHAWNRVKIGDKWYYIDCTWDDPVYNGHSGGGENHDYFLSEKGWSDHTIEKSQNLADKDKIYWIKYYLTGEGY